MDLRRNASKSNGNGLNVRYNGTLRSYQLIADQAQSRFLQVVVVGGLEQKKPGFWNVKNGQKLIFGSPLRIDQVKVLM